MKPFYEMLRQVTSSRHHQRMLQFVEPLKDHFGINHFWYYRVSYSGMYSYMGTHSNWNEYCFEHAMIDDFPCLRDPNTLQGGISLMRITPNNDFKKVLDTAWEKFHINFNVNLSKKVPEGIEGFGFATCYNHSMAEEILLNEMTTSLSFYQAF